MDRIDWDPTARFNTAVTWALAVVLLVALGGVVYVSLTPGAEAEPYTGFYVLGPDGSASDYPTNLSTGETGELTGGITNNEHRPMTYTVVVMLDNESVNERTVEVADGETWEGELRFTPDEAGVKRLDILLYVGADPNLDDEPYRKLELVVNVSATD